MATNLILDIQACKPQQQSSVTQAVAVADKGRVETPQIRTEFELPPARAQEVSVVQRSSHRRPG